MTSKRQMRSAERWRARLGERLGKAAGDEQARAVAWFDELRRRAEKLTDEQRQELFRPITQLLQQQAKTATESAR